jgi:periplasmic divalent cation tolerance protein
MFDESSTSAEDLAVVMVTAPSPEVAESLARALVGEGLAACVNVVPGVRSIYRWQGQICDDAEVLCLIKTRAALVPALTDRVLALHPYEVPEVLALPGAQVSTRYRRWLVESTGG